MEALVLPALAVTLFVYVAACGWLVFRPRRIERRRPHSSRRGRGAG